MAQHPGARRTAPAGARPFHARPRATPGRRRALVLAALLAAAGIAPRGPLAPAAGAAPPPGTAAADATAGAPVQPMHVWALQRLARADELLRRKRPRAAAALFLEVFEQARGTPWGGFAELGLAWTAVATGDLATARVLSGDALAGAGAASDVATILVALLDGSQGETTNAINRLTRLLGSTGTTPMARNVARLARGYVHFWAAHLGQAAADFDAVVTADGTGTLVDDARYGAAWSRATGGDLPRGVAGLREIVSRAPPGTPLRVVPAALVDLEAAAILRDSFKRYRTGGPQMPGAQLARLLDADGVSRAAAALRRLAPEEVPPVPQGLGVERAAPRSDAALAVPGVAAPVAPTALPDRAPAGAPADVPVAASRHLDLRLPAILLMVALAVALAAGAARARRRGRGSDRPASTP